MSDTPTPPEDAPRRASGEMLAPLASPTSGLPPTSGSTPVASSTPAKRPWTILGRLSQAVREQNWFAVVLELAIVVLGVVIGFQVTDWGQRQSDRVREQGYLYQLKEDLTETELAFEQQARFIRRGDSSATAFVRAFRAADAPPSDSILLWTRWAGRFDRPYIVTGTADALVETGDINLIQNDSVRTAVTRYVDLVELATGWMDSNSEQAIGHLNLLNERLDYAEGMLVGLTPSERDSLAGSWFMFPFPEDIERTPMPLDVDALLEDPRAYTAAWGLWRRRYLMERNRTFALRATADLKALVDAEIDR